MFVSSIANEPETLERLLSEIRQAYSHDPMVTPMLARHRLAHLITTANLLARFVGKSRREIEIGKIVGIEQDFRQFLVRRNRRRQDISDRLGALRTLMRSARKLGWSPQLFALENQWEAVRQALKGISWGVSIVEDAIARKIPVAEYSNKNLNDWGTKIVAEGRSYNDIRKAQSEFRRVLRESGLGVLFSHFEIPTHKEPSARLHLDSMPPTLKTEIENIREGMRERARRGEIHINSFDSKIIPRFEEFCGYAVYERGIEPPASLRSLLTSDLINEYTIWIKTVTDCKRDAVSKRLRVLSNARYLYPESSKLIQDLFRKALNQIEKDKKSDRKFKRRKHEVHHWKLERIVDEMHRERVERSDLAPVAQAWRCHDELLMQLLTWYPWYPSCVCNCRFTGPKPNLFKSPILDDGQPFALTAEARARLEVDPAAEFWQFSFSAEETPNRLSARGLMPRYFEGILEEYQKHHSRLTEKTRTETLFLNRNGKPLSERRLHSKIEDLTLKRAKRRITPSAFRSIFAHYWLEVRPDDYENIAQVLWVSIPSAQEQYNENWSRETSWNRRKSA